MVIASETRAMGGLSGPQFLYDETGLVLEHTRLGDAEDMYQFMDENRSYLSKTLHSVADFTRQDAVRGRTVVSQLAQAGMMFDYWIVHEGQRVGDIELVIMPGSKKPEMGYWLIEEAQGKGLATRAARCLLDYGLGVRRLPSVTMWIKPDNTPSQRLAKRLGAEIVGQGTRDWLGMPIGYDIWEVTPSAAQ